MTTRRVGQLLGIGSCCIAIVVWFYIALQPAPQLPPQAPIVPGEPPIFRADFPWTFYLGFAAALLGLVASIGGKGVAMLACCLAMLPIGLFAWLYPFPFSLLTLTMLAYAAAVAMTIRGRRTETVIPNP